MLNPAQPTPSIKIRQAVLEDAEPILKDCKQIENW